jgi:hypothetical protein
VRHVRADATDSLILRVLASGALRHSVACGHFQDQIVAMLPAILVDYTHCNAMGARLEVARQSRRPDMHVLVAPGRDNFVLLTFVRGSAVAIGTGLALLDLIPAGLQQAASM